jgi:hypothetical protein
MIKEPYHILVVSNYVTDSYFQLLELNVMTFPFVLTPRKAKVDSLHRM